MSEITVNVKWQKQKFSDVKVDLSQPPVVFKATLFSLSGVPPDRQKVVYKGGVVGDESWEKVALKAGVTVLLMGSAEALPEAPDTKVKFVEDMDESELAKALDMPPGLNNLGNTCYMNATVQCLRTMPELRQILGKSRLLNAGHADGPQVLVSGLAALFATLDRAGSAVSPHVFLHLLHSACPQFAQRAEQGAGFQQQDANECWSELVRCLQHRLPGADAGEATFTDKYMTVTLQSSQQCQELPDEPAETSVETMTQLSCFIDKDVKYLHTGLVNAMRATLTKHCSTLNRDAVFVKQSRISRLPAYLTIQFVRFFYKEREQVNAKVLKDVKFTLNLDLFQLCTDDLQQRLKPMREQVHRMDEWLAVNSANAKKQQQLPLQLQQQLQQQQQQSDQPQLPPITDSSPPPPPYHFPDDQGTNASGHYTLQAVVTHQGRSSTSGHYVGWVRKADQPTRHNPEEDVWFKFDDDDVTPVTGADILRLSGGGDWHCAYLLLYAPRQLDRDYSDLPPPTDANNSNNNNNNNNNDNNNNNNDNANSNANA